MLKRVIFRGVKGAEIMADRKLVMLIEALSRRAEALGGDEGARDIEGHGGGSHNA
jgi:hypothetical protein